jgi:hypothetical protein
VRDRLWKGAEWAKGHVCPKAERAQRRRTNKRLDLDRNLRLGHHGPWWTKEELALLGTLPDTEVAKWIDRRRHSVATLGDSLT